MSRAAVLAAVLAVGAAVAIGFVTMRPESPPPPAPEERAPVPAGTPAIRQALFAELQPVTVANCELIRLGEQHDGGYLMCGNLLSAGAAYSYGINGYDKWGCDVSLKLRAPVHQYDCFNLDRPPCAGGNTIFHGQCIGDPASKDDQGRVFDTLASQMTANGDGGRRVIVKMDVEGAEWDTFLKAPAEVFRRIDQMAVEFHGVDQEKYVDAIRRLKTYFHVAHVHFNNYSCQSGLEPFPAWAYEVLFVNRQLAEAGTPQPIALHALDAPNTRQRPDCPLTTRN